MLLRLHHQNPQRRERAQDSIDTRRPLLLIIHPPQPLHMSVRGKTPYPPQTLGAIPRADPPIHRHHPHPLQLLPLDNLPHRCPKDHQAPAHQEHTLPIQPRPIPPIHPK